MKKKVDLLADEWKATVLTIFNNSSLFYMHCLFSLWTAEAAQDGGIGYIVDKKW